MITELTRVFDFLSAGSLIANLELSFSKLSYDVMLQLEEAFYINKSLENMKIEWTLVNFTNGTSFAYLPTLILIHIMLLLKGTILIYSS